MKKFTKIIENFKCENCGEEIIGNGFTNHCPNCFYSKHVDINPGDRQCPCQGIMAPIAILQKNGEFIIQHKCLKCGFERKNKLSERDNIFNLMKLAEKFAKEGSNSLIEKKLFSYFK